ncbi:MAG: hypothetical protein JNL70_10240 [Saprospiraceae bacterium]|nr:hypothetical protein [Saprospiraceae bacterium]
MAEKITQSHSTLFIGSHTLFMICMNWVSITEGVIFKIIFIKIIIHYPLSTPPSQQAKNKKATNEHKRQNDGFSKSLSQSVHSSNLLIRGFLGV